MRIKTIIASILVLAFAFPLVAYSEQVQNSTSSDHSRDFNLLYICAKKVLNFNWSLDRPLDARLLEDDLFFILDGYKNELHIFTSYFAGKSNLVLDKDGKNIEIKKDGYPQYNIRIPYLSKEAGKTSGYYYMTINDVPFGGHHDSRINMPARFLAGEGQIKPDFTNYKAKGSIQILSGYEEGVEYHPLDIEDKIWDKKSSSFDEDSKLILIQVINSKIRNLGFEIEQNMAATIGGGRFGGAVPSRKELIEQNNKVYEDTIKACQDVAKELSIPSIQEAVDSQKNDPSQAEFTDYPIQPLWKWHTYKPKSYESKIGNDTYIYSFSIEEINGRVNLQELYSVLTDYLGNFNTCHVAENLPGVDWASFRAEFEINPDGKINQQAFKAYPLNVTAGQYEGCLYPALRNLVFKKMDEKPVKVMAVFSVARKQKR